MKQRLKFIVIKDKSWVLPLRPDNVPLTLVVAPAPAIFAELLLDAPKDITYAR